MFNMISGVDDRPRARHPAGPGHGRQALARLCRAGLGRTFQHVRLLGQRSVLENVAVGAHLRARRGWLAAMLRADRGEEAALLAEARRQIERCGLAQYIDPAASLPWASSASSRSRGRWRASPPSCCWTSRPPACATSRSRPWPNC
jgi:branched-chain amino acid transport system permease protein